MRWAALCVAIAISGCLGSDGPSDPDPEPDPPLPTPTTPPEQPVPAQRVIPMLLEFTFNTCDGMEILVHLPYDTVQAALPEGYTAISEADPLGNAMGRIHYAIFGCHALATPSTTVNDTVYGFVAVAVEGGVDRDAFYTLRMLGNEGVIRSLWTAAGYELYVGDYVREDPSDTGRLSQISFGDYGFEGIVEGDSATTVSDRRYDTKAPNGLLNWNQTGSQVSGQTVHGELSLPADDPFPDAAGIQSGRLWPDISWGPNDLWLQRA